VYSREIFLNTATIREVNSTEIGLKFMARETQDNLRAITAKLQTTMQTNFHNLKTRNYLLTVTFLAILK